MPHATLHQSHPEIIKRMRRVEGHLRGVVAMIEEGRPCLELAQQLQAIESAVRETKKALIHDHLDHCLEQAIGPATRDTHAPRLPRSRP